MRGILAPGQASAVAVHPGQLYSACAALAIFGLLLHLVRRPHAPGSVFFVFALSYGLLRIAVSPQRMEALPTMRVFSVLFVIVGVAGWLRARRSDCGQ